MFPSAVRNKPSHQRQQRRQQITRNRNRPGLPSRRQQIVVRNYLFRIFDKLGVSTRVELVLYCLQDRPAREVQMAS